jgi:hypothetical protein
MTHPTHNAIGEWFTVKWRDRAAEAGAFKAATQLRKQGVPLVVALAILVGRMPGDDETTERAGRSKAWRD